MTGWVDDIDCYLNFLLAAGASEGTARLRRHYLERFARTVDDPWAVTFDDLTRFLARAGWSAETRHSARSSLRGFYRWGVLAQRSDNDLAAGLPAVKVPAGVPRPAPDVVVYQAMARANTRAATMILLACHGLRRAEISRVHTQDVLSGELLVRGKGDRARLIPMSPDLTAIMDATPAGFVFPGQINGHLSPGHVGKVLTRLLGSGWTAHTLRHRFASRAYAVDRDVLAVRSLLGHAKVDTTLRYIQIPQDALRRAVLGATA